MTKNGLHQLKPLVSNKKNLNRLHRMFGVVQWSGNGNKKLTICRLVKVKIFTLDN